MSIFHQWPPDWDKNVAALRSTQVATGTITGTTRTTVYTVPTGYRLILKSILVLNAAGVSIQVQVRWPPTDTKRMYPLAAYGSAGFSANDNIWAVLDQGTAIALQSSGTGTYTYHLSGSLHTI